MSDAKWTPGEPVEEPTTVDDVVVSAEDSLADAEAAREGVGSSDLDPALYGVIDERDGAPAGPVALTTPSPGGPTIARR